MSIFDAIEIMRKRSFRNFRELEGWFEDIQGKVSIEEPFVARIYHRRGNDCLAFLEQGDVACAGFFEGDLQSLDVVRIKSATVEDHNGGYMLRVNDYEILRKERGAA